MASSCRALVASGLAALVLAMAAATGAAATFEVTEGEFRASWSGMSFNGGGAEVVCDVVLEGTFAAQSFTVAEGTTFGSVTSASVESCSGGTARALTGTLPWTMKYTAFEGTLPDIDSVTVRLVGSAFEITPTRLIDCLARSTEEAPMVADVAREPLGSLTGIAADEAASIPLTGDPFCSFASGTVSGNGTIENPNESLEVNLYTDALGKKLIAHGETKLNDVNVRVGGEPATVLTMRNLSGYRLRSIAIYTNGANREKFVIDGEDSTCANGGVINAGTTCRIGIRTAGATAGARTRVRIDYYEIGSIIDGANLYQEFNVIAIT